MPSPEPPPPLDPPPERERVSREAICGVVLSTLNSFSPRRSEKPIYLSGSSKPNLRIHDGRRPSPPQRCTRSRLGAGDRRAYCRTAKGPDEDVWSHVSSWDRVAEVRQACRAHSTTRPFLLFRVFCCLFFLFIYIQLRLHLRLHLLFAANSIRQEGRLRPRLRRSYLRCHVRVDGLVSEASAVHQGCHRRCLRIRRRCPHLPLI